MESFGFGIDFVELYEREGLLRLDAIFIGWLSEGDVKLHNRLVTARSEPNALEEKAHSQLLIDLAPHVEDFLARLFGIERELQSLVATHQLLAPLYACKRLFVQRRAAKAFTAQETESFDAAALEFELSARFAQAFDELAFATHVMQWLDDPAREADLGFALRYAAWAVHSEAGQHKHADGVLFKMPRKLDLLHLVPAETELRDGITVLKAHAHHLRRREGFSLTDNGGTLAKALDETNYCIFCHNQERDSCAKGMKEKLPLPSGEGGSQDATKDMPSPENTGAFSASPSGRGYRFKKSALGITLNGCPLEEKISEMNFLKSEGVPIGALAVVAVDNPMCAGTGHRICNDCMKSCIYQKQEPVNIPQAETRTLRDVLELPYGFEIYSLLTRWNPLNLARPLPKQASGYNVLVAGLGPAGYTLAHHLLNDGHNVVGIDGLKIEPLPQEISGVTSLGEPVAFAPIKHIGVLYEALDERQMAGFGGVAEYGITVRWDKNFLKVIRLLLERRRSFSMIGGVRFGSSITYENAFAMGFDHIALCMGAGRPTTLNIPNAMARGVRTASDFLMALQLAGAAKKDSIANLQLRLPVVVIGGGLTAIDTATESLAYYPVQVEKFLTRYELLAAENGVDKTRAGWAEEERIIAEEFIQHAKAIRAERVKATQEEREPDILSLLDGWGGVKIVYRKRLIDAPSYRLNHEEVEKAFQEGIFFAENWEPAAIETDEYGHAKAIMLRGANGEITLLARSILIAAGTQPNTVLHREDPMHFTLDGQYFRAVDANGNPVAPERVAKPGVVQVLMSIDSVGRAVSFFGDLHPSFAGNVVKAMGSAKQGYPSVTAVLGKSGKRQAVSGKENFLADINHELRATVHEVVRLTPNIIEVIIRAPLAARQFHPGQFYRLQNFEVNAVRVAGEKWQVASKEKHLATCHLPRSTTLAMEGLALTGAWVDKEKGLISTIVLEMGGSSDLCAYLKKGEPVILMGPTGTPTETPAGENVLLAGGGLGNAVLFSIGKAFREAGSKVLYFAGYKKAIDRYKLEEIEQAADIVIWCCDEKLLTPRRPQDRAFHGNIVEAMVAYAKHNSMNDEQMNDERRECFRSSSHPSSLIPLSSVNRIIAIGSDRMMAAVAAARHGVLQPYLNPRHMAFGSINSPMQCMMKEICAQCLQKHVDPVTGDETYVYSCFNQDQLLDCVSFPHLNERLKQNTVQEKLTAQWIDRCLKQLGLRTEAA